MPQLRKLQWWRRTVYQRFTFVCGKPGAGKENGSAHCVNVTEESSSVFAWRGACCIKLSLQRDEGKCTFRSPSCSHLFSLSFSLLFCIAIERMQSRPTDIFSLLCVQQSRYPSDLGEIVESYFQFGLSMPDRRANVDYKHGVEDG